MEPISLGKFIEIAYQIFLVESGGDDTLIYEFKQDKPDRFVFGHEPGMLEAFTSHLEGLKAGDEFDFILAPAEAFGERDPKLVAVLEKSLFMIDGEFDNERVYEGAFVPMMTAEGMRIEGIVKEITETNVTVDFNHQLAGETVRYKGKVITVRDATQEELNPPKHGCGGGCDGCQGCDDNGAVCDEHNHDGDCCGNGDCCKNK